MNFGKIYTTRQEKTIDFLIGFFGCLLVNGVFFILLFVALPSTGADTSAGSFLDALAGIGTLVLLILNPLILIITAFTRAWIALGMLSAFGTVFVLVLCVGIAFSTVCFGSMFISR